MYCICEKMDNQILNLLYHNVKEPWNNVKGIKRHKNTKMTTELRDDFNTKYSVFSGKRLTYTKASPMSMALIPSKYLLTCYLM